jgi:hypothetical protein
MAIKDFYNILLTVKKTFLSVWCWFLSATLDYTVAMLDFYKPL